MKNLLFLSLLFSCSGENLTKLTREIQTVEVKEQLGRVEVNYCLLEDNVATDVYTLVMYDESGSNCANDATHGECNYPGSDLKATDPQRVKRTKGLIKYLNEHEFKDYEYFSVLGFRCDESVTSPKQAYCSEGSLLNGIRDDNAMPPVDGSGSADNYTPSNEFYPFVRNTVASGSLFTKAVEDFANDKDRQFGTNFRKALVKIRDTIKEAAQNEKDRYDQAIANSVDPSNVELRPAVYKVVFASDGQPTDTGKDFYQTHLIDFVKEEIIGLETDPTLGPFIQRVFLSAAFYHHTLDSEESKVAKDLIAALATAGNGKYLFFDTDQEEIDFERLLDIPIVRVRSNEEHFLVNNINTTWAFESNQKGEYVLDIHRDQDGDGIADIHEVDACVKLADCDQNGLSDKVEKYLFNSQCVISIDPEGKSYCDQEYKRELCDTNNDLLDYDNDGLNNCEERQLKTEELIFDSNKDEVMDGLAFRFGLDLIFAQNQTGQFQSSRPQSEINPDNDEASNYAEVKHFTPVEFHNSYVLGLEPYQYKKTFIPDPTKPFHKCYELHVTNIPIKSKSDEIEIHFVQKEANGSGKLHYKRLRKKMTDGVVKFSKEEL